MRMKFNDIKSKSTKFNNVKSYNSIKKIEQYTNPITKFLRRINGIVLNMNCHNENNELRIQITNIYGIVNMISIKQDKSNYIDIDNEAIKYKDMVIFLSEISKLKILIDNNSDIIFTNTIKREMNKLISENKVGDIIEVYIGENFKDIDIIEGRDMLENNKIIDIEADIDNNNILNRANDIADMFRASSDMRKNTINVYEEVEDEEKLLANKLNFNDINPPIQVRDVNIITDVKVKDYNVVTKPSAVNVIENIVENKSEAVIDVKQTLLDGVIGNIDKDKNILETITLEILSLETINKYISYNEIKGKPLRVDPTGEGYVGIVLEDGTFEPLSVTLNKVKVLPHEIINVLGDLDYDSNLKKVVENIDSTNKKSFVESLNINSRKNVVEYKDENLNKVKELISFSKDTVSSITNKNDEA